MSLKLALPNMVIVLKNRLLMQVMALEVNGHLMKPLRVLKIT